MGENLALNIADHGFKCAFFNRTTETMRKFVEREKHPNLVPSRRCRSWWRVETASKISSSS
jgi:6-phosphogluconate dehydrogenase